MSALLELISGRYIGAQRPIAGRTYAPSETGASIVEGASHPAIRYSRDKVGALLPLGSIIRLAGDQAGEPLEGTELERSQLVKLLPPEGMISPTKYQLVLSWNPLLGELGLVQAPPMVPPHSDNVSLVFRPFKRLDLAELDYIFYIYMID